MENETKKIMEAEVISENGRLTKENHDIKKAGADLKEVALKIKEENELIKSKATGIFDPVVFKQMEFICEKMVTAKALPKGIENGAQAIVIMQRGWELGLKPMDSLSALYMVSGRIQLWGEAMIREVLKKVDKIKWYEATNEKAICGIFYKGEEYKGEYTIEQARAEGRVGVKNKYGKDKSPTWTKFPKNHLRFNAVRDVMKFSLPHVMDVGNIYMEGDEEVIDIKPESVIKEKREALRQKKVDESS